MDNAFGSYLQETAALLRHVAAGTLGPDVEAAVEAVATALAAGRPLLVCGNGGSAADAMHISGELVGRFLRERPAAKVIALAADPVVLTALANDYGYATVFARQVEAWGEPGGILLGISTSGNSANVVAAFETARARGMRTIALTGAGGGRLAPLSDLLLAVPSTSTPRIQEVHLCLYHYLCEKVEQRLATAADAASPATR